MRSAHIPHLEFDPSLDFKAVESLIKGNGAIIPIDTVNWPESFPYAPEAKAYLAHDDNSLTILYEVRGLDLRALELEDNAHPWENSCCEFFVGIPGSNEYMNFELVCNGALLVARGEGRDGREKLPSDVVSGLIRKGTLDRKIYDEPDREFEWGIFLQIPFDLIPGMDEGFPESLKANFYKCANKSAHPHFLSWNPIKTPTPDFHRPEYFGTLYFDWKD